MALFQTSVLKNYLKQLDEKTVQKAYARYVSYFFNTTIQENIRNSKEEQFQATFLNELFVSILGYTLNPNPEFNLTTEFKNQKNNRKADGAILNGENAVGVIELKGTNTKDLESIRRQAFDYKANQKGCVYVVTSNFEKLRFYINDATEFEEFNLFELTQDRFKLLYLCLQKDNVLNNVPLAVKESSLVEEEKITKRFYADYSLFKRELYRDLVKKNVTRLKSYRKSELQEISVGNVGAEDLTRLEKNVKLGLFKKSQKLIDRFLFIFFSEDRGLLPPNSTVQILDKWKADNDFGDERPLYDLFKQYFNFLDTGRQGTTSRAEIYAYNGGLFKPDTVLDNLEISNDLLYRHALQLAKYDFESQVDVNILGHIFENSLNEIESINAEIEGAEFDKQKSKRKKDGVYYTPKYITKYIVENTVGKLCEDKKSTLGFKEEEYFKGRAKRPKTKIVELVQLLDSYRDWLLELTICDPACGSGAFLNQALDFLIKEHRYIDELKAKILGGGIVFSDIENTILENNIYGVDLNEESVEIAKLSLWLRTAQPRRKLNDLSSNIKCGNSLIDDKKVAGPNAFSWEQQFPQIFKKGGFDVVIGNPPYVKLETIKEQSQQLEKYGYETFDKRGDLYVLFVEKGFNILKAKGVLSYIMPNKWLQAGYGQPLRSYFLTKALHQLIDFGDIQIFQGATTYPLIFVASNKAPEEEFEVAVLKSATAADFQTNVALSFESYKTSSFDKNTWVISSKRDKELLSRLKNTQTLKKFINGEASRGIIPGLTEAFVIGNNKLNELIKDDINSKNIIGKILKGRDITRYGLPNKNLLDNIILAKYGSYKILKNKFPSIYSHLLPFKERLKKRGQCRGSKETLEKPFKGQHHWLELDNTPTDDYLSSFLKPKIMYQVFQVKPCFIYDEQGLYCNNSMWFIPTDNKALLGVLNSKMGWWLINKYCTQIQNGCQLIWKYFGQIPIPLTLGDDLPILIDRLIILVQTQNNTVSKFLDFSVSKYNLSSTSRILQSWNILDFNVFIWELNKAIKKERGTVLTKKDEFEWLELFEENKKKAQALKFQIDQTEKEIDQMVYELYGLTDEEIAIIENS